MADEMNTDERAKFIHWHMDYLHTDEMLAAHIWDNQHSAAKAWQARAALSPSTEDMATASAQGFRDGVASLSSPLQSALDVIERWARDAYVVCGKPSTQEGFEAAWKAEDADAYSVWVAGRASVSAAQSPFVDCYVCGRPMDGLSEDDCHCFHKKELRASASLSAAEPALRKVLAAVQRYLPPGGPSAHDTLTEIIEVVDPWPRGQLEKS